MSVGDNRIRQLLGLIDSVGYPAGDMSDSPSQLKRLWHAVPVGFRRFLYRATNWTGLPYLVRYKLSYRQFHAAGRFAGELPALLDQYPKASAAERRKLTRRFDTIADAIVLPNGVRKTTYADRHAVFLNEILEDPLCTLPERALRVLDLPASTGASCPGVRALLAQHRSIERYVLADLAFHLQYDRERDCIFDAAGCLLQVRRGDSFHSVHLPYATGEEFSTLTRLALAPVLRRGAELRERFRAADARSLERVPLLHPDVLAAGDDYVAQEMDAFAPLAGAYDLILSCNLLQRNYFSEEEIARGTANLGNALDDNGLLVVGSPGSDGRNPHRVYRKRAGQLELVRSRGEL